MAGNNNTAVATRQDQSVTPAQDAPDYMENLMNGDLSKLTAGQQLAYYLDRCARIGLDPMSQPFLFMKTRARDGEESKTILYATRSATDQIGKRDDLSGTIVSKEFLSGVAIVTIRVSKGGRSIENVGAAAYKYDNQAGDALKRAITQGYRRGIVQFSGLGMVSEEDIADIQGAQLLGMHEVVLPESEVPKRLNAAPDNIDADTGEIDESKAPITPQLTAKLVDYTTRIRKTYGDEAGNLPTVEEFKTFTIAEAKELIAELITFGADLKAKRDAATAAQEPELETPSVPGVIPATSIQVDRIHKMRAALGMGMFDGVMSQGEASEELAKLTKRFNEQARTPAAAGAQ